MSNAYQIYSDYLFAKADERGIPLSGTFELTPRCNLDCRMCYIHKRANYRAVLARELDTKTWLTLAEDCRLCIGAIRQRADSESIGTQQLFRGPVTGGEGG